MKKRDWVLVKEIVILIAIILITGANMISRTNEAERLCNPSDRNTQSFCALIGKEMTK